MKLFTKLSWFAAVILPLLLCNSVWGDKFIRGDVNGDGQVDLSDPVTVLGYLFLGAADSVTCDDAVDSDDSGEINLGDAIYLLSFKFLGGSSPLLPFPDCGSDPTIDPLGCDSLERCHVEGPQVDELDRWRPWIDSQGGNPLAERQFDVGVVQDVWESTDTHDYLRTTSTLEDLQSHYIGGTSVLWSSYEFTGRMRHQSLDGQLPAESNGGLGVTFLTNSPGADAFYRLRKAEGSSFQLDAGGTSITGGVTDSGVVPDDEWYHFRIQVTDTGSQTEIRAKVWTESGDPPVRQQQNGDDPEVIENPDGEPVEEPPEPVNDFEPQEWQIECFDASPTRRTRGTIGVWSSGVGVKYWADLAVDGEPVRLSVQNFVTFVSRNEITWNFARAYVVGQFATGDYYVVGAKKWQGFSVLVESVSPEPNSGRHGSAVNPTGVIEQGYDSRVNSYDSSLAASFPLGLRPNQSLISTTSWIEGEPGFPEDIDDGAPRPSLKRAAVLTCLGSVPPEGSFRPPYGGVDKPIHSTSQLRRDVLPALPRLESKPLSTLEAWFNHVWLDSKMGWTGRLIHPSYNMPNYGRDMAAQLNYGILALMEDFTLEEKEPVLIRLVQIGIDLYALLENGASWGTIGGGHGAGRKWPIIFAGLMLDHAGMMSVGLDHGPDRFQEDCQTFYVTEEDQQRFPELFPVVGEPAFGSRHCSRPNEDDQWTGYRVCCTGNVWLGAVLAARILGVQALWNHPPLFDYQDDYMVEMAEREDIGVGDSRRSWFNFPELMWDTYRQDL